MNINVDIEKMKEIHGEEIVEIIYNNIDIVEKNIRILKDLNFNDVEGILERCPEIFMYFPKELTKKVENLIKELGENYVDIIQNDISILESI